MHRTHANDPGGRGRNFRTDTAADEFAGGLACAQGPSSQINREHLVPLIECHLDEWGIRLNACVGTEDVDSAVLLEDRSVHRFDFRLICDIGFQCDSFVAAVLYIHGNGVGRFRVSNVIDHDLRAGVGEATGNGLTDARISASDQGGLPFEWLFRIEPSTVKWDTSPRILTRSMQLKRKGSRNCT